MACDSLVAAICQFCPLWCTGTWYCALALGPRLNGPNGGLIGSQGYSRYLKWRFQLSEKHAYLCDLFIGTNVFEEDNFFEKKGIAIPGLSGSPRA
jgi:hypothetical protein